MALARLGHRRRKLAAGAALPCRYDAEHRNEETFFRRPGLRPEIHLLGIKGKAIPAYSRNCACEKFEEDSQWETLKKFPIGAPV